MRSNDPTLRKTITLTGLGVAAAAALALAPATAAAQPAHAHGHHNQGGPGYDSPPGYEPAPQPGYYVPPSVAMSGPRIINDWEPGEPIPPGYHEVTRIRKGLVIGGAVTFGTTYLLTALVGAAVNDISVATGGTGRSAKLLFIPVFGPFTLLGTTITASGQFGLVLDGVAQAAGVAMFVAGLAAPKHILVRNDLGKNKVEWMPLPMSFGANSGGLGVVGRF